MTQIEKWVLVTGATTGIGRAAIEYLASHGFKVYAGVRKIINLDNFPQKENIVQLKLDVTSDEDVKTLISTISERKTGLFAVVNNAGISKAGPLMDNSIEDLREQFEVNLIGIHRITQACFPLILVAKGRIIMISSDSGFFATPYLGPYCSSKFALEGYSDSLRREILPTGIKISLIQPGRISTEIWNKAETLFDKFKNLNSIFKDEAFRFGNYAIRKGKTEGLPPIEVAKAIYLALTSEKPKLRYLVAKNATEYKVMRFLSGERIDRMVRKKIESLKE